jgi:flagellum-specific peptidoglycan hydrolase FlgJ
VVVTLPASDVARADETQKGKVMTTQQVDFLRRAMSAAEHAGHIFPEMAACEAALESKFGDSDLAAKYNNLFGCKQHHHPVYGTHILPTNEFLDGKWQEVNSSWIVYPTWAECFADRMTTLLRLQAAYAHYRAAIEAKSARDYVIQVSESWSTDPGWRCSCGQVFLLSADSAGHVIANPTHHTMRIPGDGRAEKVLTIYDAIAGSETDSNSP